MYAFAIRIGLTLVADEKPFKSLLLHIPEAVMNLSCDDLG